MKHLERLGTGSSTQKVRIMSAQRPRTGRRAQWVVTAVPVVALLLAVSACGSDSEASSSASVDTAGLAEAKETVAKAAVRPTSIPITTPIDKPVPSGKKI